MKNRPLISPQVIPLLLFVLFFPTLAQGKPKPHELIKETDLLLPTTQYYYTWVEELPNHSQTYYIATTTSASPIALLQWHFRYAKGIVFFPDVISHRHLSAASVVCTNPDKSATKICNRAKTEYSRAIKDFKPCDQSSNTRNSKDCSELEKKYRQRFPWVIDLQKIGFIQVEPKQKQSSTPAN